MPPNIATIPAHASFLDVLARRWLEHAGPDPLAIADGLILLPTRRAARSLHEAFLRATDGKPLLLPRIEAIGAPDETPFAITGALDLPPAIGAPLRLAMLTRMILALQGAGGAPTSADRAWPLAGTLAQLLDEAARAEIDLRERMADLVDAEFADHWATIIKFLTIITEQWPRALAAMGISDIADRQVALMRAEAQRWDANPPAHRVWAAGSTGGIGAVAHLLAVVARLPGGQVILPGLDRDLPDEVWDQIEPGHPQASLRHLLARMGAVRGDVVEWSAPPVAPPSRVAALNLALRPADFLPDWTHAAAEDLGDVQILEPSDQQEEALAIAIALRQGLQTPGNRVALITPDRGLAVRVAAELARFGVVADDSAGEDLAATPPALFLRLLIVAVQSGLAPVALLAFLKHPLAAFGMRPSAAREAARRLEKSCLRGPAPAPGIASLRAHLAARDAMAVQLLDQLEPVLAPLTALLAAPSVAPDAFLETLIRVGEQAATTDEASGASRLWALEEGEALAEVLAELRPAFAQLPAQDTGALPGLLAAALEGHNVRSRRALRGRTEGSLHPRVFIWGLLEARLQTIDLAVLGGLTETVWPLAADPGPWMNRKMRAAAGLPSPEEQIEQAAHDFVMASCCAPKVIFSVPKRRDGAPAVPARWITRLVALLRGWQQTIPVHPAIGWACALDHPVVLSRREKPAPRPPVAARPKSLSVTDVELWFNDPYGLYAKKILNLPRLDPLEQNADHADFGNLVHAALAKFFERAAQDWPQDAAQQLEASLGDELDRAGLRASIAAWWRPRLARIARFIDEAEAERRALLDITERHLEIKGALRLPHDFELRGRADRIERLGDEGFAIIDYKTGSVPTEKQVEAGLAPQLPLEAMMVERGGFKGLQGEVHELAFWKLSGGREAGRVSPLWKKDQRAKTEAASFEAYHALLRQIVKFQNPEQPYLSAPDPRRMLRYADYALLARRAEWAAAEDDDGESPAP